MFSSRRGRRKGESAMTCDVLRDGKLRYGKLACRPTAGEGDAAQLGLLVEPSPSTGLGNSFI